MKYCIFCPNIILTKFFNKCSQCKTSFFYRQDENDNSIYCWQVKVSYQENRYWLVWTSENISLRLMDRYDTRIATFPTNTCLTPYNIFEKLPLILTFL